MEGNPTRFKQVRGFPPIAYTSLMAFAAAIWPNRKGSSTGGVIKSAVVIIAISSVIRYTPASSFDPNPTRRFGSLFTGRDASNSFSPTGLIFAAQPQVLARLVNVCLPNKFLIII